MEGNESYCEDGPGMGDREDGTEMGDREDGPGMGDREDGPEIVDRKDGVDDEEIDDRRRTSTRTGCVANGVNAASTVDIQGDGMRREAITKIKGPYS